MQINTAESPQTPPRIWWVTTRLMRLARWMVRCRCASNPPYIPRLRSLLGRLVDTHRRELVISRGRTGYVALYRWFEASDSVLVLAIKHQREAGYAGE